MITKYIKRQETINLAVVPCNVDVATTEALEMAREVDPKGNRTLGILTKPDLVDKGTEQQVLCTVQNKVYPLKKGYMMVKCRGQKEIQDNISLQDALKKEKEFFTNHQDFRPLLDAGLATIPNLAERLSKELVTHIAKSLPNIKYQIKRKLQEAEDELNVIGGGLPDSDDERIQFLMKIITDFTAAIKEIVTGEQDGESEDLKLFKNLRKLFNSWDKDIKHSSLQFVHDLRKERNFYENYVRGRELLGFTNYRKMENMLHKQILTFQEPAIKMLHTISELVQKCFINEASKWFEKFGKLHEAAMDKIQDISRAQEQEAEKTITLQFEMEGIIYCQDSMYSKALSNERAEGTSGNKLQLQEQGQLTIDELACKMQAYLTEATTRLSNQIPLIIQHYVLKENSNKLHTQMLLLIQNKQNTHLLEETHELSEQRQKLKNQIQRLRLAQERVTKFTGHS
uniref:Uncharacterized protein n=2 Tax=Pyxicephalus adspersus TaxID=30357 RepID=A0AAV3AT23_PYXAD|nr:TPA: hypothetical protein GDO54_002082 [Pyxicephalus adspersus]